MPKYAGGGPERGEARVSYLVMRRPLTGLFLGNIDILEMIPTLRFRVQPPPPPRSPPDPEA